MTNTVVDNAIAHPHDVGYRRFLSSKKLFLELLRSFVEADWVHDIDEDSLFQMDGSFVAPDFHSKEADVIYRIKLNNQDVIFIFSWNYSPR